MKNVFFLIIVSFLIFSACNKEKYTLQSDFQLKESLWTFIQRKNDSTFYYAEVEFENDQTLRIRSELKGSVGPFDYCLQKDTLRINDIKYKVISDSLNGSLVLKNESEEVILYRIPFKDKPLNKNQINPFYLRRCYFLVHLNLITYDDAVTYLENTFEIPKDSMPEEEILFIN